MISRKSAAGWIIAGFLTAALQACGNATDSASGSQKPVEVRLGYFANLTHAQAVLGVSSGDFEKAVAPNKLTTRVFNAGPSLIEAMFANEIDIGYVGPGPALSGFERSRGEGLRVIAGAAANGVVIVARPDSGINSMDDLVGKKIATPQLGNTQDIAAKHYVTQVLNQPNANNVIPVPNAEQLAMMSRGQIDAAWVPEPWGARLIAEANAKIVAEEMDFWPGNEFVLTVVIVRPEFAARHPDIVERILEVHTAWTARLKADAKAQISQLEAAMLSLTGKQMDRSILENAISRVRFTDEPMPLTFETFSQWSLDLGFSKDKPDLTKLMDLQYLERAHRTTAAAGGAKEAGP